MRLRKHAYWKSIEIQLKINIVDNTYEFAPKNELICICSKYSNSIGNLNYCQYK